MHFSVPPEVLVESLVLFPAVRYAFRYSSVLHWITIIVSSLSSYLCCSLGVIIQGLCQIMYSNFSSYLSEDLTKGFLLLVTFYCCFIYLQIYLAFYLLLLWNVCFLSIRILTNFVAGTKLKSFTVFNPQDNLSRKVSKIFPLSKLYRTALKEIHFRII